jgi:hypothetical protein
MSEFDRIVISMESSLTEESMYRLFIMSSMFTCFADCIQ